MLPSNKPSGSGGREGVVAKGHHGGCRRQLSIACLTPDFRLHIYVNRVRVTTRACRILWSLCVCVYARAWCVCMLACTFACACACLRTCVRSCFHGRVRACACARAHARSLDVHSCFCLFVMYKEGGKMGGRKREGERVGMKGT